MGAELVYDSSWAEGIRPRAMLLLANNNSAGKLLPNKKVAMTNGPVLYQGMALAVPLSSRKEPGFSP